MNQAKYLKEPVNIHPILLPVVAAALVNRIERGGEASESDELVPLFKHALRERANNQGMLVGKMSAAQQIADSLGQYLTNFNSATDKLSLGTALIATGMDTHSHAAEAQIKNLISVLVKSLGANQPDKILELNYLEIHMLLAATTHQFHEVMRDGEGDTPLASELRGLMFGLEYSRNDKVPFIVRDRPTALRLQTAVNSYVCALRSFGEEAHVALRMISCDMERLPHPTDDDLCNLRRKLNAYAAEMDV